MRDLAIRGQLGSKSVGREQLVTVVVLDDLPDSLQGHGVGVHLVRAHIVEGSGLGRVTCEIVIFPQSNGREQEIYKKLILLHGLCRVPVL